MTRYLLASCGALFLGSIAAFYLFVPVLAIIQMTWLLACLLLVLGFDIQLRWEHQLPLTIRATKIAATEL